MANEDFVTDAICLRYNTQKHHTDPAEQARWQLVSREKRNTSLGSTWIYTVIESDVELKRALEIADLLGCREEAIQAMQNEITKLNDRAKEVTDEAMKEKVEADELAHELRETADKITRQIGTLPS